MKPADIKKASDALVTAVENTATTDTQNIEARAAQLAPELAGGSNVPGGYMYARHIAPVVPALTANIVAQARQQAVRSAIADALHKSSVGLETAQRKQRERQRAFQLESKRINDANAAKARAQQAAYSNAIFSGGGGGGSTIGGGGPAVNFVPQTGNLSKAQQNNGVFWRGADGKVWVKGGGGTNAAGAWDKNTQNYWQSRGFTLIADPNPPRSRNYVQISPAQQAMVTAGNSFNF